MARGKRGGRLGRKGGRENIAEGKLLKRIQDREKGEETDGSIDSEESGKGEDDDAVASCERQRKSWAQIVETEAEETLEMRIKQPANFQLEFVEEVEEQEVLVLSDEEIQEGCNYWRYALVGYVVGTEVSFQNMLKFVKARWKEVTEPEITKHESGLFLFNFKNRSDMVRVLEGQMSFVFGKPLLLKKWEPEMTLEKKLFESAPVWVKLPDLKLQYWSPRIISKLVSKIGKPLMADSSTVNRKRLAFARVLVDIHPVDKLVNEVRFRRPDGETEVQKIVYEWWPMPCSKCLKWGHKTEECKPKEEGMEEEKKIATGSKVTEEVKERLEMGRKEKKENVQHPNVTSRGKQSQVKLRDGRMKGIMLNNVFENLREDIDNDEGTSIIFN